MRLIKRLCIASLASIGLVACAPTPPPTQPRKPSEAPPSPHQPNTRLKGWLVNSPEATIFTPCQGEQAYWLDLSSDDRQLLSRFANHSQVYVEFDGRFNNVGMQAPEADYRAKISPQSWQYLASEGPGCEAKTPALHAMGNEPSWRIDINEGKLQLSTLAGTSSHPIYRSGVDQGTQFWQSADQLRLAVKAEQCFDSMADTVYAYHAELLYQGLRYQGCARRPFQQNIEPLSGNYQAKLATASGSGRMVNLTLNQDLSAELQNNYLAQDKSFIEKGYWQPLDQTSLLLTLSQSQNQPVNSQMYFDWDGMLLRLRDPEQQQQGKLGLNMMKMNGPAPATSPSEPSHIQRSFEPASLLASSDYHPQVEGALKQYFKLHRTALNGTRYQWWKFDLNGDGQDEIITYLDWCGSGGCSLLIFEAKDSGYRFLSKTTLVRPPFYLASSSNARWQDLLLEVSGGGAIPGLRLLRFDGLSYPVNPSIQPDAPNPAPLAGITFLAEPFSQDVGRALK
ncbi:copper resistance protein NlpE N-terminal domain-containing protein [Agarivorans sp. Z349TD_8]|uniref:copper resistance protein NlpE N-terminal domain-containing protein n=1 Tax=Agarivorans sp. Z349TD_8 TaxID=3421434 RepID=UPI003D7ED56E